MKLKCLHCEHEFEGTISYDEFGWHSSCPECGCSFDVDINKKHYYDVVASIYDETCRTDSRLICGGFNTVEEAINYINEHDVSEENYYWLCVEGETAYIEIERHNIDGSISEIVVAD